MSQPAFSRRVLLSAAAAAGAAISLPFGAESKESTTMDKKDMEGIRHYEFGNVTVTSISDGTRAQDPGLSLASKERIEELVRQSCQTPDTLEHYVNVFHIKSGRRSVVIDTGYGIGKGLALTRLFSEVKPTTITDVLITHCHPDHISGLTHNGEAAFPKAKVWVPKTDYEFFTGESVPEGTRKATAEFFAPYEEAGHLKLIDKAETLFGDFSAEFHPGHTPGHAFFVLDTEQGEIVFAGDVAHVAAVQFADPTISARYDMDSKRAAAERIDLFTELAESTHLLAGGHLPFPGIGRVRKFGSGFEFLTLPYRDRL